jgi:hypothetical protein
MFLVNIPGCVLIGMDLLKVSELLTASIVTVLHSSWAAVNWKQEAGPNRDTYVTYTL